MAEVKVVQQKRKEMFKFLGQSLALTLFALIVSKVLSVLFIKYYFLEDVVSKFIYVNDIVPDLQRPVEVISVINVLVLIASVVGVVASLLGKDIKERYQFLALSLFVITASVKWAAMLECSLLLMALITAGILIFALNRAMPHPEKYKGESNSIIKMLLFLIYCIPVLLMFISLTDFDFFVNLYTTPIVVFIAACISWLTKLISTHGVVESKVVGDERTAEKQIFKVNFSLSCFCIILMQGFIWILNFFTI